MKVSEQHLKKMEAFCNPTLLGLLRDTYTGMHPERQNLDQDLLDFGFTGFVLGAVTVMDKNSFFNLNWSRLMEDTK